MTRLFAGVLLLGGIVASGFAQGARQELEALHREYAKNLVAKDYVAIERFYDRHLSRDFTWAKYSEPVMSFIDMWEGNRRDMENKKQGIADGPLEFRMTFTKFQLQGDEAIIEVKTLGRGEWHREGTWTPLTFEMQVRERWRKQEGRWVAVRFQDLAIKAKFGKPRNRRFS